MDRRAGGRSSGLFWFRGSSREGAAPSWELESCYAPLAKEPSARGCEKPTSLNGCATLRINNAGALTPGTPGLCPGRRRGAGAKTVRGRNGTVKTRPEPWKERPVHLPARPHCRIGKAVTRRSSITTTSKPTAEHLYQRRHHHRRNNHRQYRIVVFLLAPRAPRSTLDGTGCSPTQPRFLPLSLTPSLPPSLTGVASPPARSDLATPNWHTPRVLTRQTTRSPAARVFCLCAAHVADPCLTLTGAAPRCCCCCGECSQLPTPGPPR